MSNKLISLAASLTFIELLISITGVESLQCYNCRGITNYDPNGCFEPTAKTIVQECLKNEVCEKRVTMVDRLQDVIDRGCSANCAGRTFIWTDEYQVYCCNDKNKCNAAPGPVRPAQLVTLCLATIATLFCSLLLTMFA